VKSDHVAREDVLRLVSHSVGVELGGEEIDALVGPFFAQSV